MTVAVSKLGLPYYLANVISVAKVDGDVPPPESAALREIIRRIGATDQDLADAGRILASGHYRMHLPEGPQERMANVEDMVMVALGDGNLSPEEAVPIERAAKRLGFSQADMDMVVRRARQALRQLGIETASPPAPPPLPPPVPSGRRIAMRVAPAAHLVTTSPPPAVSLSLPQKSVPPPLLETSVPPSQPEKPLPDHDQQLDATTGGAVSQRVQACMARRALSSSPAAYCFGCPDGNLNIWGCRLAGMDWTPGAAWLELGKFRDDATFVFDKQAIADRLAANLAGVLCCPHLHVEFAEKAFDELPARALARGHWRHRKAQPDDFEAATIHKTRFVHGCPLSITMQARGLDPQDTRVAEKVIGRALRATGRHDIDLRRLRGPRRQGG